MSACSSGTTGSAARSRRPRSPQPGFKHDVFSAWHPLWVGGPAHAQLGDDARAHGLEYLNTELPTATLFPDGESAFLLRTAEANAAELDRHHAGDGDAWNALLAEFFPNADLAFGVLGTELWSRHGAALGAKAVRRLGRRRRARVRRAGCSSRRATGSRRRSSSERAHGLLAPWVLHTGLGPDAAASGYMAQVIAVAVQEGGMPIPRGGGAKLADALVALHPRAGRHVRDRRARRARVRPAACAPRTGETITARDAR